LCGGTNVISTFIINSSLNWCRNWFRL